MSRSRSSGEELAPGLVLGPLLRYAGPSEATVWVETDAACEVEVLVGGATHRSRTFRVGDHHYALVYISGLSPGAAEAYEVRLDGRKGWPESGSPFPPSVIRTPGGPARTTRLIFGSCRISAPHEPPYTLGHEQDERGLGVDALYATAMRLRDEPARDLPDALVLLGDQIYAHKPPFDTLAFLRSRRDTDDPPGEAVANFEEYTRLYRDAWGDLAIRWLLSTVPSAMIFDDHEVSDDWNISEAWVEEMRRRPWWEEQITGAYASYWLYQHLGNLSPEELAADDLFTRISATDDAWPLLLQFASHAHRRPEGIRWSFHRDFGNARLVVMDSRGGRVLEEGRRSMVDEEGWRWIQEHAIGGFDHLLLGASLPFLLGPGMHHLQAWNEAVCSGVWGARAAAWAEGVRRSQDLDHWASFHTSFVALADVIKRVGAGERGEPPASIVVLSGDVHHGYLAEATFRDGGVQSPVYQAVCSPFRNELPGKKSRLQSNAWTKPATLAGRLFSRLAGVEGAGLSWRLTHEELWFENQIATLVLEGRRATLTFAQATLDASGEPTLRRLYERRLA